MKKIVLFFLLFVTVFNLSAQNSESNTVASESQNTSKTIKIKVDGMSCQQMCANGIDKKLKSTKGVETSKTTLESGLSIVTYDPAKISSKEIVSIIEKRNYKARVVKE